MEVFFRSQQAREGCGFRREFRDKSYILGRFIEVKIQSRFRQEVLESGQGFEFVGGFVVLGQYRILQWQRRRYSLVGVRIEFFGCRQFFVEERCIVIWGVGIVRVWLFRCCVGMVFMLQVQLERGILGILIYCLSNLYIQRFINLLKVI